MCQYCAGTGACYVAPAALLWIFRKIVKFVQKRKKTREGKRI